MSKSNQIVSRSVVIAAAMFIFSSAPVGAGSVKLIPQDTLDAAVWSVTSGGRVAAVTDGVDGVYIFESSGSSQRYSLTNTSGIPVDATIDSFVVWTRAQVTNDVGTDRIRHRIRMDGNSNFCDGANIDLTNTWTDYKEKFMLTPATAGTCTGALSIARMDSLNIQYLDITGDENRVTKCSVVVWYTETGGETKARRRHLLISDNVIEKFVENNASGHNRASDFFVNCLRREE